MPNRILKESICTSEDIDELGWFCEVLFYRLIVNCDDYGRFDARNAVLRARLFPLSPIQLDAITNGLDKLEKRGMIRRYTVGGKPYLELSAWSRHQNIRAQRSRYPAPEEAIRTQPHTDEFNCMQMYADDIRCTQPYADVPGIQSNPNRIQSQSVSKSKTENGSVSPEGFRPQGGCARAEKAQEVKNPSGRSANPRGVPSLSEILRFCPEMDAAQAARFQQYCRREGWRTAKAGGEGWKALLQRWRNGGIPRRSTEKKNMGKSSFDLDEIRALILQGDGGNKQ